MIGVLAELERSLISERTRAGVKAAKRRGVKFGRKVKLTSERSALKFLCVAILKKAIRNQTLLHYLASTNACDLAKPEFL